MTHFIDDENEARELSSFPRITAIPVFVRVLCSRPHALPFPPRVLTARSPGHRTAFSRSAMASPCRVPSSALNFPVEPRCYGSGSNLVLLTLFS